MITNSTQVWQQCIEYGSSACAASEYEEAERFFRQAMLEADRKCFSSENSIATVNNLAWVYQQQGKYANAKLLYMRALRMAAQTLGSHHKQVDHILDCLASLYRAAN